MQHESRIVPFSDTAAGLNCEENTALRGRHQADVSPSFSVLPITVLITLSSLKLVKNESADATKSVSILQGKSFFFLSDRRQVQLNLRRSVQLWAL